MLHCDILDPQDAFDLEQYKQDACLDDITAHANLMQFYTVPSSPTPSGRHSRSGGVGSILRALVDVDRRRIAHVLRNLVSNALTFTPSGGEVSVTIRLSRRMGPKSTPTYLGKNSIHRTSSRGSGSIFGSLSTPNEDPATIENTLSNSERMADGPSDLLSFDNCVTQTGFMHKPEESPLPAPGRPVCFSRDSRSESNAFHGDCTVRSAKLDCVMSALSEEDSSASHTPGNRRSTGGTGTGTGTGTPHNTTRFEEDGGFFRTGWLRRKARSEKSKLPARQKKKNPSYVIIEVTDTGSGIAKENLDRVFKEIVQFNPNELHGGGHGGSGRVRCRRRSRAARSARRSQRSGPQRPRVRGATAAPEPRARSTTHRQAVRARVARTRRAHAEAALRTAAARRLADRVPSGAPAAGDDFLCFGTVRVRAVPRLRERAATRTRH